MAAAVAGLIAAEIFLQATQSRTMRMGFWFSPGIHSLDERFGFVFTPNYVGVMQHPDGVIATPLSLDELGFRQPVDNRPTGPHAEVLFIGGMSMMFSYGLSDQASVPAQAAFAARHPVRVRNTAWPGFDIIRNYQVAQALLGVDFPGDVVVLGIYWMDGRIRVQTDIPSLDASEEGSAAFRFHDGLVVRPEGLAPYILGPLYDRSFLAYTAGWLMDRWVPRQWLRAFGGPAPLAAKGRTAEPSEPFDAFLRRAVAEIRRGGAEPLVAFLPMPFVPGYSYKGAYGLVPPAVHWVDLHKEMIRDDAPMTTIALHYTAETAHAAGQILGREIDAVLDARSR